MYTHRNEYKDYKVLKAHCKVLYAINGKEERVGDLRDDQLDFFRYNFSKKRILTPEEKIQYDAIKYVSDYRSECVLNDISQQQGTIMLPVASLKSVFKIIFISIQTLPCYEKSIQFSFGGSDPSLFTCCIFCATRKSSS